jgi:RNA polymerase sigma-70 factor (ECF subfamily)
MADVDALIIRWQAGDELAAEALYDCHHTPALRLAYGLLGDPTDAEEAAHDALVYILTHIDRYDPQRGNLSAWLHTVTVSRCRDRLRRRRLLQLPLVAWLRHGSDVADPGLTQERLVIQAETRDEIWQAIQNLAPRLREAIVLRYWAEHTYREIAQILGCPVPTAQSRVRLAYQRLRAALAPDSLAELSGVEEGIMR